MLPVKVCVLLASLGIARASGESTIADDFLSVANGIFDNWQQVQSGTTEHVFVQYRFFSVDIPSLHPVAVWYTEWVSNGTRVLQYIGVLKERPDDTIRVTLYNYTDLSIDGTSEFHASNLQHLKPDSLWDTKCTVEIRKLRPGLYLAIWPDCNHVINGFHAFYVVIFECDASSSQPPPTIPEEFVQTPYIFQRTGDRYPITGRTDNYERICPRKH